MHFPQNHDRPINQPNFASMANEGDIQAGESIPAGLELLLLLLVYHDVIVVTDLLTSNGRMQIVRFHVDLLLHVRVQHQRVMRPAMKVRLLLLLLLMLMLMLMLVLVLMLMMMLVTGLLLLLAVLLH